MALLVRRSKEGPCTRASSANGILDFSAVLANAIVHRGGRPSTYAISSSCPSTPIFVTFAPAEENKPTISRSAPAQPHLQTSTFRPLGEATPGQNIGWTLVMRVPLPAAAFMSLAK